MFNTITIIYYRIGNYKILHIQNYDYKSKPLVGIPLVGTNYSIHENIMNILYKKFFEQGIEPRISWDLY
jgi:hypothetical protein